jgi:formylglycine-generating enzyme required for sulfatase activity
LIALMLGILLSAELFVPVPRRARAQQGSTRQLTQEGAEKQSGGRIALVIGNSAYTNAPRLKNPINDATDIADALSHLGFTVEHGVDLNQKQMKFMIREFGKKLKAGGQGLFYFSGHGVQLRGHNYLVPVDADITSEADVEDQGVDANLVLGLMDEANNGLNVVILDACRNNPFARSFRSASGGLAQVDAPTGTLIAYATAPGRVAQDGVGRNGTYTAELLKQMRVPGLAVEEMFKRVRANVRQQTGGEQVPWEASSLVGDFYFNRAASGSQAASNAGKETTGAKADPAAVELEYWETIKNSTDAEDFRDYLKEYPAGTHAVIARSNVRRLEAAAKSSASEAKPTNTVPAPKVTSTPETAGTTKTAGSEAAQPVVSSTVRPPVPSSMLRSFEFTTVKVDGSGKLKTRETKRATQYVEDLGGAQLEMVEVPGGTFMMGSPETEANRSKAEGPQHQVTLRGFYMGKYEVTQAQYQAVMGTNPSSFKGGDLPVENVSWNDAVEFCKRLSAKTGREYRLPSEAEWEYAARAGTTTPFAFGETITPEIVNCYGESLRTMAVGWSEAANGFGLYDMHGNVWEWCLDYWHDSYSGLASDAPTDGSAWMSRGYSNLRVVRGGSHVFNGLNCRSATRFFLAPGDRDFGPGAPRRYIGFRVVVSART